MSLQSAHDRVAQVARTAQIDSLDVVAVTLQLADYKTVCHRIVRQ
jgi:hypothetical protein